MYENERGTVNKSTQLNTYTHTHISTLHTKEGDATVYTWAFDVHEIRIGRLNEPLELASALLLVIRRMQKVSRELHAMQKRYQRKIRRESRSRVREYTGNTHDLSRIRDDW